MKKLLSILAIFIACVVFATAVSAQSNSRIVLRQTSNGVTFVVKEANGKTYVQASNNTGVTKVVIYEIEWRRVKDDGTLTPSMLFNGHTTVPAGQTKTIEESNGKFTEIQADIEVRTIR